MPANRYDKAERDKRCKRINPKVLDPMIWLVDRQDDGSHYARITYSKTTKRYEIDVKGEHKRVQSQWVLAATIAMYLVDSCKQNRLPIRTEPEENIPVKKHNKHPYSVKDEKGKRLDPPAEDGSYPYCVIIRLKASKMGPARRRIEWTKTQEEVDKLKSYYRRTSDRLESITVLAAPHHHKR